jgi:hypothetical protein
MTPPTPDFPCEVQPARQSLTGNENHRGGAAADSFAVDEMLRIAPAQNT